MYIYISSSSNPKMLQFLAGRWLWAWPQRPSGPSWPWCCRRAAQRRSVNGLEWELDGNHPQMEPKLQEFQSGLSGLLSFTQTYPTIATIGSLNNNCSYSDPIGIFLGKWHNNCSDPLEFWMIYQCKSAKDPTQNLVLLIQKVEQSWFSTTHTHIYIYRYMYIHMYIWS